LDEHHRVGELCVTVKQRQHEVFSRLAARRIRGFTRIWFLRIKLRADARDDAAIAYIHGDDVILTVNLGFGERKRKLAGAVEERGWIGTGGIGIRAVEVDRIADARHRDPMGISGKDGAGDLAADDGVWSSYFAGRGAWGVCFAGEQNLKLGEGAGSEQRTIEHATVSAAGIRDHFITDSNFDLLLERNTDRR
jgi:hypothetical protein